MKIGLIVLLALALLGGILWVAKPWRDEVELTYAIRFPPEFTGDRKAAVGQTAFLLCQRLSGIDPAWNTHEVPDGHVRIRFKGLKGEDVAAVRRRIETPGRLAVYRIPPGQHRTRFWTGQTPLVGNRDLAGVSTLFDARANTWGLRFDLLPDVVAKVESVEDALLGLVLDDEFLGVPGYATSPKGTFLTHFGLPDEKTARDWAAAIVAGPFPFPLGEPQVGRHRGDLK